MPDGSSAGRGTEVMAGSDRVVLRRLAVRPKPRKTTLIFGVSQMILGLAIVAISFTAFALSTSNRVRNACPYWAGFSLSFFTFLSAVCVVLHLVATALSGLSGADLQTLVHCRDDIRPLTCHCCEPHQSRCAQPEDMVAFEGVGGCRVITATVKELMYSVCVTNIVACVVCIAATIIGCAYIVKRHASRRMVVRRSQCSNLARDSFFSDIIMPTDSVFTPPVAPPPPYSPPDYTAISNDRVLMESGEFMDDLSTPTPVIGPQDMPPPYSVLDLSPGGTIECAVAQEYQVDPNEIHRFEPHRLSAQTAISNSYNPGRAIITVCQRNNTEQIPTPPLRWDSHHVARITPLTRMDQSGGNAIEPQPHQHHHQHTANVPVAPGQTVGNNRRHAKSKSRPRSGGSPRASPRHRRETRQSLPAMLHRNGEGNGNFIIVDDGLPVQSRLHPSNGSCLPVVIMRHHRGRPPPGNRVSTASQTSLEGPDNIASSGNVGANTESINVGDKVIASIPCSVSQEAASRSLHPAGFHNTNEGTEAVYDNNNPAIDKPEGAPAKTALSLIDRKASSSSGSVSGPPTSVPSQTKSSSSNERLTGTSSSHTSRDSASAIGRKQRRRHSRHTAERRRVSSSTTCSTSPTDCSSRSSTSGSFGRARRSRNRYISTSSSSDSEEDQRPPPPRRVIIARMANGGVRHEMLDPNNAYGYTGAVQREHAHRRSSGSSANTPPRGRPKHKKTNGERAGSVGRRTNSSGPPVRYDPRMVQSAMQTHVIPTPLAVSSPIAPQEASEQVHLRQKRPNSLNLRLSRKSHPAAQPRPSQHATVTFVEESDPWIHRDTERTYASVGVQSMPEQTQTGQALPAKSIQPPADVNPPLIGSAASAPTPSTNVDPLLVPKPKPRPKSMVELSQDTSVIVSSFLRQAVHGLSPAIKTVLEDIQSVITTDEQYLAEAMQSHSILDEYIEKSNSLDKLLEEKKGTDSELPDPKVSPPMPSPVSCKKLLRETLDEKCGIEGSGILPIPDTKLQNRPDKDLMGINSGKHEAVLQDCLVKTLESARETVL
ncbi:uncharacterized protein LOC110989221 isoform X2 [Acanthaster planci]|uniref:Uncharacterized protein LOC110989221 isoform X2 n=1 Tax=Acanthaster planci TaxID=133434 RepID=A0A8B7ZVL9_ACAPL|nr:uncharacterized protein LOC110989221 isoform X2 [Acanthaster planci]